MVPNIESGSILLLGYSILYKEYNLTRFNHQKKLLIWDLQGLGSSEPTEGHGGLSHEHAPGAAQQGWCGLKTMSSLGFRV